MADAAMLVSRARIAAGLSRRGLAARAGVTTSTVSRIENGEMDPTLTMLRRVLAGASRRLQVDDAPIDERPTIAALAAEALEHEERSQIDWTLLRGFADWARRHPGELPAAVEDPPARTATPLDAILASFTEELCRTHGCRPPRWTADVPALDEPWQPDGTPRMLRLARAATPDTFAARNITLDRADLFRDTPVAP